MQKSEESRRKRSEKLRGRPIGDKTKVAVSRSNKTRPVTQEMKHKMRVAQFRRGKARLNRIFGDRGWTLLSSYEEAEISIRCQHGEVFSMKRRSATQSFSRCPCDRRNGLRTLMNTITSKGWMLISSYESAKDYLELECAHGRRFHRYCENIKATTVCDCDLEQLRVGRGRTMGRSGSRWKTKRRHKDMSPSIICLPRHLQISQPPSGASLDNLFESS
jgi:hypothetical protein